MLTQAASPEDTYVTFMVNKVGNHDVAAVGLESSGGQTSRIILRLRKELCVR